MFRLQSSSAALSLVMFLMLLTSPLAANPIVIQDFIDTKKRVDRLEVYQDYSGRTTIDEILRKSNTSFALVQDSNFGLTKARTWIRYQFENRSSETLDLMLDIDYPSLDALDIFDSEGRQLASLGDRQSRGFLYYTYRLPVFKMRFAPGRTQLYLAVKTEGSTQVPLRIWSPEGLSRNVQSENAFFGVIYGFLGVMIFYNSLIAVWLRSRAYLYYVLFSFLSTVNFMNYHGISFRIFPEPMNAVMANSIGVIGNSTIVGALWFTFAFLAGRKLHPWVYRTKQGLGILATAGILVGFFNYNISIQVYMLGNLVSIPLILSISTFLCIKRYRPAYFFTLAWFAVLMGHLTIVLSVSGVLESGTWAGHGAFVGSAIEVVLLSLALGDKMRHDQQEARRQILSLNQNLEVKVEQRTAKIRSLLTYIPQGILSIGPDGLVDDNFSAQLPSLIGQKNVGGRSFYDIVLSRCHISEDERDQIWQSILASIGTDTISFEANRDKLPRRLSFMKGEQRLEFRCTWNNEASSAGETSHILVTLLDVSHEMAAEAELLRKKEESILIHELVDAGEKKANQFFLSGLELVGESQSLLSEELNDEDLKVIYINLHTMKGEARSVGFRKLAAQLHSQESVYAEMRKKDLYASGSMPLENLISDMADTKELFDNYMRINREVLGRSRTSSSLLVEKSLIKNNLNSIIQMEALTDKESELNARLKSQKEELTELLFRPLKSILQDCEELCTKIANDLGKPTPGISYKLENILLSEIQEAALRKSLVHLFRNAVDHGIEPARDRLGKGKSEQGQISIRAFHSDSQIAIELEDDGRGLNLEGLRKKMRGSNQEVDRPELIAESIFQHGLSTAERVTQFSGRGVGMGAVRRFLEDIGGHITIQLHDQASAPLIGTSHSFHWRITLPNEMAQLQAGLSVEAGPSNAS